MNLKILIKDSVVGLLIVFNIFKAFDKQLKDANELLEKQYVNSIKEIR